jgi:hypothetical protein
MKIKFSIDWKKFLTFFFVCLGLLYITGSVLMTAGIVLLLLVIDRLLAEWDENRKRKEEQKKHDERNS